MPGTELAWFVCVPKNELIASGICWKASPGVSESGLPQLSFLAHLGLGGHPSPFSGYLSTTCYQYLWVNRADHPQPWYLCLPQGREACPLLRLQKEHRLKKGM